LVTGLTPLVHPPIIFIVPADVSIHVFSVSAHRRGVPLKKKDSEVSQEAQARFRTQMRK